MKVPYIEKSLGDKALKENKIDEAMKHYYKVIMSLKVLFDEKCIQTDEEATKYISECGVRNYKN